MGSSCCADCARKQTDTDAGREAQLTTSGVAARSCTGLAAPCAPSAGNQELLRLARSAQRSALHVGAADDPAEREAEATADDVTAGRPVRRSMSASGTGGTTGAGPAPGSVSRALRSPGRPLDGATRSRLQRGFGGADLSGVRVHDSPPAAASATDVGARAYTAGSDIVFAPGQYAPATAAGTRLIAHEVAHVLQQSGGAGGAGVVRRQGALTQGGGATTGGTGPPPAVTGLDTDVCLVDAGSLTNDALLAQTNRVKAYLGARRRGQDDYYAYANLGRRLDEERLRRIRMGHVYLAQATTGGVPSELYRLTQVANRLWVSPEDPAPYHGTAGRLQSYVMSQTQFDHALEVLNIPHVDLRDYFAQQGPQASLQLLVPPRPAPPPLAWPRFFGSPFGGPFGSPFGGPFGSPFGGPTASASGFWLPSLTGGPYGSPYGSQVIVLGGSTAPAGAGSFLPTAPWTGALPAGGVNQSLFSINARGALSEPLNYTAGSARSRTGALTNYRGALPEVSYGGGSIPSMITQADLNAVAPNFRVFDFRSRAGGATTSVTSTMPTPPVATGARLVGPVNTQPNWTTYDRKFLRAFGQQQQAKFGQATADLNTAFGTSLTTGDVAATAYLAINDDHVEGMRTRLRADIPQNPNDYAQVIDGVLRAQPIELRTTSGTPRRITGWNDLQAARPSLAAADYQAGLVRIADLAALRVVPSGITTEQLVRLTNLREFTMTLTPEQYRAQVPPELVDSMRYGGTGEAAWRAGVRGGVIQGGVGTAFDAYRMATDQYGHPYWLPELGARATLQVGGGVLTSSAETAIVASTNEALLGQVGTSAMLTRGGARLLGGVGPAVVVAPLVATGTMALDELFTDAYYTNIDYAVAATRSGVAAGGGALAGAGAAALYGAAAGSEVPGVGNAIGLVVGFLGYLLVDAIVGDDIEREMRLAMGEGGCPRPAPTSATLPELPEPAYHYCFGAGTAVLMADGTTRPVEQVRRGDKVVAVDVVTLETRPEVVETTRVHASARLLSIALDTGGVLRVTPEHPVFSGAGWQAAGELRPGNGVLCCLDERLVAAAVVAVVADPPEAVFDVTVSGTHTLVADGVVVHNKNI